MKLVKVVVEEMPLTKHLVLVVEKVVVKERPQILVVLHNTELVVVVLKDQQFVKRVEYHLHLITVEL